MSHWRRWKSNSSNEEDSDDDRVYRDGMTPSELSEDDKKIEKDEADVNIEDIRSWYKMAQDEEIMKGSKYFKRNDRMNKIVSHYRGDITVIKCDAIVNAANTGLWAGGGICGAIHSAAGRSLAWECDTIRGCPTGEARITNGYQLPAKYVIHGVGPVGYHRKEFENCYESILNLCAANNVRSVVMCCISTGIYGFPNAPAAQLALLTVRRWLEKDDNIDKIDHITFCTFLRKDKDLYLHYLPTFFPTIDVQGEKKDDDESNKKDNDESDKKNDESNKKNDDESDKKNDNDESTKEDIKPASKDDKPDDDTQDNEESDNKEQEEEEEEEEPTFLQNETAQKL